MQKTESFKFEKLIVYQKALDTIDYIYTSTASFPKDELYGLSSQLRRAAVSVALNIAEGTARSKADFRRFLDIAQGSICECIALLEICKRRKYMQEGQNSLLRRYFSELSKMISGLKKGIGFSARNEA